METLKERMARIEESKHRRQMLVGRVSKLVAAGYSVKEICAELNLAESTVRNLKKAVDEANRKKAEMDVTGSNVAD